MAATVPVTYSDGTSFTQFPGTLSTFLSFATDDTARLTVSGTGVLTLLVNNSYTNQVAVRAFLGVCLQVGLACCSLCVLQARVPCA
jgi:autotransporter-associated beta strand protein